jgi:hypothetical protein
MFKSWLRGAEHIKHTREMITAYKILVENIEEKKLLGRLWHTWVNNIVTRIPIAMQRLSIHVPANTQQ